MTPQAQLPSAAIPTYSEQRRDVSSSAEGGLLDAREHATQEFQGFVDYVQRAFRAVDIAQKHLQQPEISPAPSPPSASASTTPQTIPNPVAHSLLQTGSIVDKMSQAFGGNFVSKEMSRMVQGNPAHLRAIAGQVAQSLQSAHESSDDFRIKQFTFGLTLLHLYELTYDSTELEAGVGATAAAANMSDGTLPPATTLLIRNWAYGQRLFARRESTTDPLDRAIKVGISIWDISLEHYPSDLAGRRLLAMELAECLLDRYRAVGGVQDLNDALDRIWSSHEDEELENAHSQCVLSDLYIERFLRLGRLADIDKALYYAMHLQQFHDDTLSTTHPDASHGLHVLAMTWAQRFTVVSDIEDFDKAVTYGRSAVRICPETHPLYPVYLADLATLLYGRNIADHDMADLEESIEKFRRALEHVVRGTYVHYPAQAGLGLALARHGELASQSTEIDEGIHHLTVARKAFSGGAHLEARLERDLSAALLIRYRETQERDDLDEAIRYASSALDRCPADDHGRDTLVFQLGDMLATRFALARDQPDMEGAVRALREVATGTGQASVRLQAALRWEQVVSEHGPAASLEPLKVALDVFPLLAWSGNRMVVQYKALVSWAVDVGPRAAAHAIACGQLDDAVSHLERGRNVLWAQWLKLQPGARRHQAARQNPSGSRPEGAATTEFDSLSAYLSTTAHGLPHVTEEHMAEIAWISPQLHSVTQNLKSLHDDMVTKLREQPAHRPGDIDSLEAFRSQLMGIFHDAASHSAATRWKSLQEAMKLLEEDGAGFSTSLKEDPRLIGLLSQGYVVFVNTSVRADALVLRRTEDGRVDIDHLPLPGASSTDALSWAESIQTGLCDLQDGVMGVRELEEVILIPILQQLWRTVASPILAHLSIHSSTAPKRIWWCPTGPLAFLPIHAAGPYEDGALGVPDLVISSYTSTLQSLLRAHGGLTSQKLSMLAVGMPETPDLNPLPAVRKELETIDTACARFAHTPTFMVGPAATTLAVSRALPQHTWLHFSCHAYQDPSYAFDSAFFLHNGSLSLGALMQLDLTRVQFAFLSACLTSAGDARLPDECIHLAAGMQFAGVSSTVATLWTVDDRAAAFVTSKVYGRLMREGLGEPDPREAAEALHAAVGEMKAAGRPMVFWVPFLHVGI